MRGILKVSRCLQIIHGGPCRAGFRSVLFLPVRNTAREGIILIMCRSVLRRNGVGFETRRHSVLFSEERARISSFCIRAVFRFPARRGRHVTEVGTGRATRNGCRHGAASANSGGEVGALRVLQIPQFQYAQAEPADVGSINWFDIYRHCMVPETFYGLPMPARKVAVRLII